MKLAIGTVSFPLEVGVSRNTAKPTPPVAVNQIAIPLEQIVKRLQKGGSVITIEAVNAMRGHRPMERR